MNQKSALESLHESRAIASQEKKHAVLEAIELLTEAGRGLDVSAVAKAAKVSRQFIYSHDDLRVAVQEAASRSQTEVVPSSQANPKRGWHADRATLQAKIERQAATIADLREQVVRLELVRQRLLGAQLEGADLVDPEEHTELRITCERLLQENQTHLRRIDELRRLNDMATADLRASRQAHSEDMSAHGATLSSTVVPLRVE